MMQFRVSLIQGSINLLGISVRRGFLVDPLLDKKPSTRTRGLRLISLYPRGLLYRLMLILLLGIPSVNFVVGGSYVMLAAQADSYFNFDTKRYEITVDIVAQTTGSDGNRPAGQITNVSGAPGFQVINNDATVFGSDLESNADLTTRCLLGYSVDSGTAGGYASTSAEQIGVIKSKIVKSGDPLMMRDYDPVRHKHIGGKVDIWTQGLKERQITEKFAFTFEIATEHSMYHH